MSGGERGAARAAALGNVDCLGTNLNGKFPFGPLAYPGNTKARICRSHRYTIEMSLIFQGYNLVTFTNREATIFNVLS